MEHAFNPLLLFFMSITMSFAADLLQNPSFENPPSNTTTLNSTSQFLLLNRSNTIPGWSSNGTIWYVSSGENLSFPGNNGHAIQLGENGKIRQTVRGTNDEYSDYILTFNLVSQNEYCANNRTSVNISVHESRPSIDRSKVIVFETNLSRNLWGNYGLFLGSFGKGDAIDIQIKSVDTNSVQSNVSCWPIVDAFRIKRNDLPRWYEANFLSNGDFEIGPPFTSSSDGIILTSETDRFNSPLQQWSILGTIKYINSKNYKVPHANAAIQLLSGAPSGIEIDLNLEMGISYTLNFTIGDANDSCVGDLMLFLQIANEVHNFTLRSIGTGTTFNHFIGFRTESTARTSIVFYSFNETRRSDGVLCGPVLDNVILLGSYGERVVMCNGVLIFSLFLALMFLFM